MFFYIPTQIIYLLRFFCGGKGTPTRKYEAKANQPPVKTANKCFDHKIEYDNNSEIERERERVSDEKGKT